MLNIGKPSAQRLVPVMIVLGTLLCSHKLYKALQFFISSHPQNMGLLRCLLCWYFVVAVDIIFFLSTVVQKNWRLMRGENLIFSREIGLG